MVARPAALFLGLILFSAHVSAQTGTATLSGQLKDESGAVLPGVTVTARGPALQVPSMTAVTDAQGEYRLTPLPIGTYTVEYILSGFQTVRRDGIRLTAGFTARVDVQLKVDNSKRPSPCRALRRSSMPPPRRPRRS